MGREKEGRNPCILQFVCWSQWWRCRIASLQKPGELRARNIIPGSSLPPRRYAPCGLDGVLAGNLNLQLAGSNTFCARTRLGRSGTAVPEIGQSFSSSPCFYFLLPRKTGSEWHFLSWVFSLQKQVSWAVASATSLGSARHFEALELHLQ